MIWVELSFQRRRRIPPNRKITLSVQKGRAVVDEAYCVLTEI